MATKINFSAVILSISFASADEKEKSLMSVSDLILLNVL